MASIRDSLQSRIVLDEALCCTFLLEAPISEMSAYSMIFQDGCDQVASGQERVGFIQRFAE